MKLMNCFPGSGIAMTIAVLWGAPARLHAAAPPVVPASERELARAYGERAVGYWGTTARLDFSGAAAFPPAELRRAVQTDASIQVASHPAAPLEAYLQVLERRLTEGYRQVGFSQARVTARAEAAAGRIVVSISEGPRARLREVRVEGTDRLTSAAVAGWLALSDPEAGRPADPVRDLFRTVTPVSTNALHEFLRTNQIAGLLASIRIGEPVPFTMVGQAALLATVRRHLAEEGWVDPGVGLVVSMRDAGSVADLIVTFPRSPAPLTVRRVAFRGLTRQPEAQAVAALALPRGSRCTSAALLAARQRLEDSGRFVRQELRVESVTREGAADLRVDVIENPRAPLLGETLSPAQSATLRAARWFATEALVTDELLFEAESPQSLLGGYLRGELALGGPSVALRLWRGKPGQPGEWLSFALDPELFRWRAGEPLETFAMRRPAGRLVIRAAITAEPNPAAGGELARNATVAAGFTSKTGGPPVELQREFAPAIALMLLADDALRSRVEAGRLRIENRGGNLKLEFDAASGRLASLSYVEPGGFRLRVRSGTNLVRELTSALPAPGPGAASGRDPLAATVETLFQIGFVRDLLFNEVDPRDLGNAVTTLGRVVSGGAVAGLFGNTAFMNGGATADSLVMPPDFARPSPTAGELQLMLCGILSGVAEEWFEAGSWPWTTLREYGFALGGRAQNSAAEMKRLDRSDEPGPLGCLAASRVATAAGLPAAGSLAMKGLLNLRDQDLQRDLTALLDPGRPPGRSVERWLANVARLSPEQVEDLAGVMHPEVAAAWRRLAESAARRGDRPVLEVITPAVQAWWKATGREVVRRALRDAAAAAPVAPSR